MYDRAALPHYLALGYTFLAIAPREKVPVTRGWRRPDYTFDLERHIESGGNLGVKLGARDLVIDIDPRNFPAGRDVWAEFRGHLPPTERAVLEAAPRVRTGSGGLHIYLELPEGVRVRGKLHEFPGIDFKHIGGYVLAAGCMHPNGTPYTWVDDGHWALLGPPSVPACPEVIQVLIEKVIDPAAPAGMELEGQRLSCTQLADCLGQIDVAEYQEHDDWLELGMAAWYITRGEGREEWVRWCAGDPDYEGHEDLIRERWATWAPEPGEIPVTGRTFLMHLGRAGGALRMADQYGPPPERPEEALDEPPADPRRDALDGFNRIFALVEAGGKARVYRKASMESLSTADFKTITAYQRIMVPAANGEMRAVRLADQWLEWADADRRRGLTFEPWPMGGGEPPGRRELNLFTGWAVSPGLGSWQYMRQLILDEVCSGDRAACEWVLNWLTWLVQRPQVLPETAIVLRGPPGTGKGMFGRWVSALAAPRHRVHMTSMEHLTGRFNAHLREALIVFADEAIWAANAQGEAALKGMITEPELSFEPKGLQIQTAPNCTHLIAASNKDWVVPAQIGERRFVVFDMAEGKDTAFFQCLQDEMEGGGLEAMAGDLMRRDLGPHPREHRPETAALVEQKLPQLGPIERWWLERLRRGTLQGATAYEEGAEMHWDTDPVLIMRETILGEAARFTKRSEDSLGKTPLGSTLRKLLGRKPERPRPWKNSGKRPRFYLIPPLPECRQAFEQMVGGKVDW